MCSTRSPPPRGSRPSAALLATDRTITGVARLRTDRALARVPGDPRTGLLHPGGRGIRRCRCDGGDWAGPDALHGLDPVEATADHHRSAVRADRRGDGLLPTRRAVDRTQPLTEMGMDSLMAVRIRNTARADFGVEPPVALLLQGASLRDLATDLIRQLGLAEHDGAAAGRPGPRSGPAAGRRAAGSRDAAEAGTTRVMPRNVTRRVRCAGGPDSRRWLPQARPDQLGGEQDRRPGRSVRPGCTCSPRSASTSGCSGRGSSSVRCCTRAGCPDLTPSW